MSNLAGRQSTSKGVVYMEMISLVITTGHVICVHLLTMQVLKARFMSIWIISGLEHNVTCTLMNLIKLSVSD